MPSFTSTAVAGAVLAFFASTTSSHLIMQHPVPFGVDSLDNSPLQDAFPGNYPCKQRPGVYDISTMNKMAVGAPQELSFKGEASHGGGTCQIAVSLDPEPSPNSTFKIIQVFEGGCPVKSGGNTGTDQYTFTIPKGFPNGIATMAWFWNNKVGNREAYMNCAPITVTGGSDGTDYYDSLPNLFLANLPSSECKAPESSAVIIPNPGEFVVKDKGETFAKASGPKCEAMAAAQTEGVKGYQGGDGSNGGGSPPAPTSAPDAAASGAPSAGGAGGAGSAGGEGKPPTYTSGSDAAPSQAPPADAPSQPPAGSYGSGAGSSPATQAASAPVTMSTAVSAPAAPATTLAASASAPESYAQLQPSGSDAGVAAPSGAAPSGSSSSSSGGSSTSSGEACADASGGITCSDDGTQFGVCTAGGEMVWRDVAAGTKCANGGIEKRSTYVRRHVRRAGHGRRADF